MSQSETTYKSSGVDINAGNSLVEKIKPLIKSTNRAGVEGAIGGFGGLFDLEKAGYKNPILVSATDGVGTKLKIASAINKHDTIGIDLVAMCVNDLVVQGAEPLFFLDYFATGSLNVEQAQNVISGISEGCKQAGCALIGGETAEMPGMYQKGDYDLAGFSVGAVEKENLLPSSNISEGDVIIALPSSGIHSNGYSLVRHIVEKNEVSYSDKIDGSEKTLGEILIEPTKIYVKDCLNMMKTAKVKGFAHITGGGVTENIPRILPDALSAEIDCSSWEVSEIFKWVMNTGNIKKQEMLKTFNCGVGMVAILKESDLSKVKTDHIKIGKIVKNNGDRVIYQNLEQLGE